MTGVRTHDDPNSERCAANNSTCTKGATLQVTVDGSMKIEGAPIDFALCVTCAKALFNALGFMIMSQTGESLERLVGLKKRKGDRP